MLVTGPLSGIAKRFGIGLGGGETERVGLIGPGVAPRINEAGAGFAQVSGLSSVELADIAAGHLANFNKKKLKDDEGLAAEGD